MHARQLLPDFTSAVQKSNIMLGIFVFLPPRQESTDSRVPTRSKFTINPIQQRTRCTQQKKKALGSNHTPTEPNQREGIFLLLGDQTMIQLNSSMATSQGLISAWPTKTRLASMHINALSWERCSQRIPSWQRDGMRRWRLNKGAKRV